MVSAILMIMTGLREGVMSGTPQNQATVEIIQLLDFFFLFCSSLIRP
jgi:hypothetical protein